MAGPRLFHSVAQQISDLIEQGLFPPGTRLPGERELAERFDVSRVTIREAEIALQATGRLEIKTGSGVYVSEKQTEPVGRLPDVSAFELTEARLLVESEAAALAAKNISDDALDQLEQLIETMATSTEELSLAADQDFHATIARASGNAALIFSINNLWRMRRELPQVVRVYESVCEDDAASRAAEHLHILEALRSRNPTSARLAMREHFQRLIKSMLDATEQEALREVQQRASETRERFLNSEHAG